MSGTLPLMATFDGLIEAAPRGGAWVAVPFDAKEVFGSGRPKVAATFDGIEYRGSIDLMGGRYVLGMRKDIRAALGKGVGDSVCVTVAADTAPRVVEVPADFATALDVRGLRAAFDSHRRKHVHAIEKAKKPETRARRIARAHRNALTG